MEPPDIAWLLPIGVRADHVEAKHYGSGVAGRPSGATGIGDSLRAVDNFSNGICLE
jgi:hypothetical protein